MALANGISSELGNRHISSHVDPPSPGRDKKIAKRFSLITLWDAPWPTPYTALSPIP